MVRAVIRNVSMLLPARISKMDAGESMSPRNVFFSFSSAIMLHWMRKATTVKARLMTRYTRSIVISAILPYINAKTIGINIEVEINIFFIKSLKSLTNMACIRMVEVFILTSSQLLVQRCHQVLVHLSESK